MAEDRNQPFCLALDGVWMLHPGAVYLAGWMWDPNENLRELSLVAPEGTEIPLAGQLVRVARTDVARHLEKEFNVKI